MATEAVWYLPLLNSFRFRATSNAVYFPDVFVRADSTSAGSAPCGLHLEYMTGLSAFDYCFYESDRLQLCIKQLQLSPDMKLLLLCNISFLFLCLIYISGKLLTFLANTGCKVLLQQLL